MNVFEAVKQSVTTRQAAEHYGIRVNRNGMCVCPFHNDKHPSMKVDKRFHCFGCQADGDVIDFVAKLYGLTGKKAAMKLAADFGISYDDRGHGPPVKKRSNQRSGTNCGSGRRSSNASVSMPVIFICWRTGKSGMRRSRRISTGIRCLWKPCKNKIMWNICWTRC